MSKVFLSANNIISSLGLKSEAVVDKMLRGESGLQPIHSDDLPAGRTYASQVDMAKVEDDLPQFTGAEGLTQLEKMMSLSLFKTMVASDSKPGPETGLLVSTTKGNIDALRADSPFGKERAELHALAATLARVHGFETEPVVISNACISGLLAISVAKRLILAGRFKEVYIAAGDLLSDFTLSGFASFQALSAEQCKPFCETRSGINLGEAACSVLVSSAPGNGCDEAVQILGSGCANDANHISGPSRTGEGLYRSISSAMEEYATEKERIGYISAHGTGTDYNDSMESIAFDRQGMQGIPINSLKGFLGHTLGASGLLETIIGMHSMARQKLIVNQGMLRPGVSKEIALIRESREHEFDHFLKTASGFGGSNAAVVFKRTLN